MAGCLVPACDRDSYSGGMCCGHYWRRRRGNFDDSPIGTYKPEPPIPPGLLEACTARLEAVRLGADEEQVASIRLRLLVADLLM